MSEDNKTKTDEQELTPEQLENVAGGLPAGTGTTAQRTWFDETSIGTVSLAKATKEPSPKLLRTN